MSACVCVFVDRCCPFVHGLVPKALLVASDLEIDERIKQKREEDEKAFQSIDEEVSLLDASEWKPWALPSWNWETAEDCSKLGGDLFCSVPLVADKDWAAMGKCRVTERVPWFSPWRRLPLPTTNSHTFFKMFFQSFAQVRVFVTRNSPFV